MVETRQQGPIEQRRQQPKKRHRLRLLHGYHIETDVDGNDILFSPNEVFVSSKPLYRRWPEKFAMVEDYVPLTAKGMRLTAPGEDVEDEDEDEGDQKSPLRMEPPSHRTADTRETVPAQESPGRVEGTAHNQGQKRKAPPVMLESMTVAQLKEYAEEEEIDLQGATRKEDIITAIQMAEEDDD